MEEDFKYDKPDYNTLDSLMEGFQLIGYDWRYLYVNDSVVTQSKCNSKQDLLGKTKMEVFPGYEKTEGFKAMNRCMTERISQHLETEFVFPDYTKGWFELRIQPVPKGIFILSMNITERKRAEQEKKDHLAGLEEMIYMTSHRVRQPVANILGVSSLLDGSAHTNEELCKMAGYMKESAKALDLLTRELTAYIHNMRAKAKTSYE